MDRSTHPLVLVLAVVGGLALAAVLGMFVMMGGTMGSMKMLGC